MKLLLLDSEMLLVWEKYCAWLLYFCYFMKKYIKMKNIDRKNNPKIL